MAERSDKILQIIGDAKGAVSIAEIAVEFSVTRRTILRDLNTLIESGLVRGHGEGRGRTYSLVESLDPLMPGTWNQVWLERYEPNRTFLLSADLRAGLAQVGSPTSVLPAGTYARRILDRLLIDLSWSSSQLEGNTYTLLDTEELIIHDKVSKDHSPLETAMVLNHKAAIEFMVENADAEITSGFIRNLHALLSENLLADPGAEGKIRVRPVLISGTEYVPTADPITIKEGLESICTKAERIEDPFEASFFLLVHLPYLQPFIDVNKRVSRLAANLPFIKKNYYPLSFLKTDRNEYLRAMLDIYERNDISALAQIFASSYRYSAAKYSVIAESLGQPDPIRLQYRQVIKDAVATLIRDLCRDSEVVAKVAELQLSVPTEALEDVRRIIREDIAALNEGNYSKYPVRPSEFMAWQNLRKK
jgi:Fic family protein